MNDDRPVVLVIDDPPALCAMVEQMLDEEGYAVEIATDGVTGAQRAAAGGVDVVLLDLVLPGIEAAADSPVAVAPWRDELDAVAAALAGRVLTLPLCA
jgi:CheY-like chemotaxis protein